MFHKSRGKTENQATPREAKNVMNFDVVRSYIHCGSEKSKDGAVNTTNFLVKTNQPGSPTMTVDPDGDLILVRKKSSEGVSGLYQFSRFRGHLNLPCSGNLHLLCWFASLEWSLAFGRLSSESGPERQSYFGTWCRMWPVRNCCSKVVRCTLHSSYFVRVCKTCFLTDYEDTILQNCQVNIEANTRFAPASKAVVRKLDLSWQTSCCFPDYLQGKIPFCTKTEFRIQRFIPVEQTRPKAAR